MFFEKESVECQKLKDPSSSNEKTELAAFWRIFLHDISWM
jgi:hypothetical protein